MLPPLRDLFGDVVVTRDDIELWLTVVARLDPDSPRAEYYVRAWDVVGKIKRAKLAGTFDAATTPREPAPAKWWLRFHWH